jgi:hypothetical protein
VVTYDAVRALWIVTVALLIGAAWFVFFGSSATQAMQVTPDVAVTLTTLPCTPSALVVCGAPGFDSITKPGKSTPITFACSTVWDRWVAKPGAEHDGATYVALTGASSPDEKWYGDSGAVLTSANAVCQNSEQGRLHLFWTLLAIAALVVIASEVTRRAIPFEVES